MPQMTQETAVQVDESVRAPFCWNMSPQFRAWLGRLAEHERMSTATMLERIVVAHARKSGFGDAPKR